MAVMSDSGEKRKRSGPGVRTGEDYLDALDDGRRVYIDGELVENMATHPKTRGYAQVIAEWYDAHRRPELQDVMTFEDGSGERRATMWLRQRDKEELAQRRRYHDVIHRLLGAGYFARLPEVNNSIFLTYIDDPDPWEANSIDAGAPEGVSFAENIRAFWRYLVENDMNVAPAVIDPPVDRSRPEAEAESPNCRVVSRDREGIVVRGVKAIATGSAFSDWLMVGVFFRPGLTPDQTNYFVVPTNAPGVSLISREPVVAEDKDPAAHPFSTRGDELDNMIVLEDVFVPWQHVFHMGNPDHAFLYPQRLFDWIHYSDLVRFTVKTELMAGLALLIGDSGGLTRIPAVASRIADIIRFKESVLAHLVAADETGFVTPGGMYKPNNIMFDFGRAHYHEHVGHFANELLDLSGRSAILQPGEGDWERFGDVLETTLRGAWTSGRERLKVFRVVRDLFLTDWAGRGRMFDMFNGTPLNTIRLLTLHRTEYDPNGPLTAFARETCGIPLVEGQSTVMDQIADYARAQDARTY
jgi:aromatic ring hydroxylase